MKKIFYLLSALLFTSCYSPAENMAIAYIRNHCKSPSSFKVTKCESHAYIPDTLVKYDTAYYYKDVKISHIDKNVKYDSIRVLKLWRENSDATWVNISFEASNSFGVMLSGYESVIVRDGNVSTIADDIASRERKEIVHAEKFSKAQRYK